MRKSGPKLVFYKINRLSYLVRFINIDCCPCAHARRSTRVHHTGDSVRKLYIDGAGRENRTLTMLPLPDFESGASTSSAIPASQ